MYEGGDHKSSHQLEAVYCADTEQTQGDSDYLHSQLMPGDYNYLDPNYMPASWHAAIDTQSKHKETQTISTAYWCLEITTT